MKTCPKCGAAYGKDVIFCPNDGTVLDQSAGALTGKIIADRYRVLSQIGEGGMGQVYLAEHVHMKRKCAVKLLNPDLAGDAGALKRFIREASNASRIDHPNVVTIYDFGETQDGSVYLAMEFVEGESLRKRIERQSAMPRDIVASIIRQTASALSAAHALGIVHRDLKPDNIMLVTRDGEVRVKVVDFGIAKAKGAEQKVTVTGALVGTPDYMSPEQLMGEEVEGHTDQYALALVAVKMLTGKLPFAMTTSIESLTSRLTTEPMALRQLRTDVAWPQQLQDVIGRALSSDPSRRFANVHEFSRAFDKALGAWGSPLSATVPDLPVGIDIVPPTRVRGGIKARATPKWPIAAAAAVLIMAGGATAVGFGLRPSNRPQTDTQTPPVRAESAIATSRPRTDSVTELRQQADPDSVGSLPATAAPKRDPALFSKSAEPPAARHTQRTRPESVQAVPRGATAADSHTVAERAIAAAPAEPRREPARDTVPRSATPAVVSLSSSEVASELAAVRGLVVPDATGASLATAVTRINAALPRVAGRSDSIRLLYARAQAHALQEDVANACRTLAAALGLAKGSTIEANITRTAEQLNCP